MAKCNAIETKLRTGARNGMRGGKTNTPAGGAGISSVFIKMGELISCSCIIVGQLKEIPITKTRGPRGRCRSPSVSKAGRNEIKSTQTHYAVT